MTTQEKSSDTWSLRTRFLTDCSTAFLQIQDQEELLNFICERALDLLNNKGVVTIAEYNENLTKWKVARINGDPTSLEKTLRDICVDFGTIHGPVCNQVKATLSNGKLAEFPLNVEILGGEKLAKLVPEDIFQKAGFHSLHMISLLRFGKTFGTVNFISSDKTYTPDFATIETFIHHASTALERIEADTQIYKSRKEYEDLLTRLNDVVFKIDQQGKVTFISPQISRITGKTTENFIGADFESFAAPEDRPLVRAFLKNLPDRNTVSGYIRVKDRNTIKYVKISASRTTDQQTGDGITGLISDVTEKYEQEIRLSVVYKMAKIAHYEIHLKAEKLLATQGLSEMTGLSPGWHPASALHDLVHPEDTTLTKEIFETCKKNKTEVTRQYRLIPKDQSVIKHFHSKGFFEYDKEGQPVRYIGTIQDITEKVLANRNLMESRKMLDDMGDMARIGGWQVDPATKRVQWTKTLYDLFGLPYDQKPLKEAEYLKYFPAADQKKLIECAGKLKSENMPFDVEVQFKKQPGQLLWVRITGEPLYFKGRITGSKGTFQDISMKKRAERALAESEKNYKALSESNGDYIMRFDRNARLIYTNNAIQQEWGKQYPDLIGRDFIEILGDSETSRDFVKTIKSVFISKKTANRIIHTASPDEETKYFDWRLFPIFDETGKVETVLSVSRDVTDRIQSEKALEMKNQQLTNIIKSVPGAVYKIQCGKEEAFEFVSSQIKQITGYSADDLRSKKISYKDLIFEGDREMVKTYIDKAAKSSPEYEVSYRITSKSGKEKWIWEKGVFVTYGSDRYREGILSDITDRVKHEDRIISATLQAEDMERRRIAQEIHDGVQQKLVSSLMILQNLASKISKTTNDPDLAEQLTKGLKMLQTGVAETNNIAYSIMPKSIQDFGLVKTLESMIALLEETCPIKFKLFENLGTYRMDNKMETSLYKITQEAISNIVKYSQARHATIQLIKNADTITLTVEDDGKGFVINEKSILYAGLGISSMKSRTNAVGGTFDISSKKNFGTTVLVEIPIKGTSI